MSINIREYQPNDLDTAIALFQASVRQVAARDYTLEQIEAWVQIRRDVWEKRLRESDTWIVIRNGEMAGFANVEFDGHLDMMFVHPEYQRVGVATALLKKLEHVLIERAIPSMYVEVSITAKPFFITHNFLLVEVQQVQVRGQSFINYRMRKPLSGNANLLHSAD